MSRRNATFWSKVGETGVGKMGVGEQGISHTSLHICDIGVGAGPAGLVLAGPLFSGGGG